MYHREDGGDNVYSFADSRDLHQSTDFQQLNGGGVQDENDGSISGTLTVFDKHHICKTFLFCFRM